MMRELIAVLRSKFLEETCHSSLQSSNDFPETPKYNTSDFEPVRDCDTYAIIRVNTLELGTKYERHIDLPNKNWNYHYFEG